MPKQEIKIGVSACLLGQDVRYDGGNRHNQYLTENLATFFELVPVCPEAEIGMGIPRETVRLDGDVDQPKMIASQTGKDWTGSMNTWSRRRVKDLAAETLCGFIFKKRSPSCGVFRVPVINAKGQPIHKGRGLFAAQFTRAFPLIPVEEEGRLTDPKLRENFLERVFAYDRVMRLLGGRWKRGDVVAFHSRQKYLLLAHSPKHEKTLGRLVADIAQYKPSEFRDRYLALYMEALTLVATPRRHVNALQHIAGHLRDFTNADVQHRLKQVILDYGQGLTPLIVPMTLLKHYVDLYQVPYVQDQIYLNPHPKELMLRNHV